jgi:hypothetical protein
MKLDKDVFYVSITSEFDTWNMIARPVPAEKLDGTVEDLLVEMLSPEKIAEYGQYSEKDIQHAGQAYQLYREYKANPYHFNLGMTAHGKDGEWHYASIDDKLSDLAENCLTKKKTDLPDEPVLEYYLMEIRIYRGAIS